MRTITVIPQTIHPLTHEPKNKARKKNVAAYARVSTKEEEQTNSYNAQIDHYTAYCSSRPDWNFVGMYADKGITGTSRKHRVQFNKMIEDALDGKIDLIVLKSVQRFARNTLDTVGLARQLREAGVEVIFEENNITNFDPNGELNLTINASIAQEESRQISSNVKWGKDKRYRQGIISAAYSHFLGYDKHPTDPKIGFIVNKEQAEVVRKIYKEFLRGKTPTAICKLLESEGIKTPTGKDKWSVSTVTGILTNEKYKGDAHIRKTYVSDYLTKKIIKNKGEVESFYVTKHHEPIIDREEWEIVQDELKRRKELGSSYSCSSTFSGRLFCGDCGKLYGLKVWHSTSEYRREVYQCNAKFDKNQPKCKTPTFTEDELKGLFLKAYAKFIGDKKQIIEDTDEMVKILCDTTELEKDIGILKAKDEDVILLAENLISKNAIQAMNPDEFERRYNEYNAEHIAVTKKINKKKQTIKDRKSKALCLQAFVKELKKEEQPLQEFDEIVWCYLVERATVNRDGSVSFLFRNGAEIVTSC